MTIPSNHQTPSFNAEDLSRFAGKTLFAYTLEG